MDCFLCCVFCVLYCSVTLYYSVLLFFLCVLYCSLFLYCTVSACDARAATLTEVFPCFFLVRQIPRYNSQRRGTARTSQISFKFVDCYVCSNFFIVTYVPFSVFCVLLVCKCVLYYCHRVSKQLQLNVGYISISDDLINVVTFLRNSRFYCVIISVCSCTVTRTVGSHFTVNSFSLRLARNDSVTFYDAAEFLTI
jgi:hypothetical protein